MSVHKAPNGWVTRWREAGKHKGKLFATEAEARIFDREKHQPQESPTGITVSEVCQEYHLRHQVQESTSRNDAYKLSRHIMPILGDKYADLLTTRDVDLYVTDRLQTVKRTTVARELRLLKAIFSWAESQYPPLVLRNQIRTYKLKNLEAKEIPMPPTLQEVQRIMAKASPHLERAVKLLWYTGMRPGGELLNLTWQDVDLGNGDLRVTSARKGGPAVRIVPLRKSLQADLQTWLAEDRLNYGDRSWRMPIVHYNGQRVQSIKGAWRKAKQAAGIAREIRLYDLRHAFASNRIREGGDLKSVSEILGHSRPDTTLREYQHVTRVQHREIVEMTPDLENVHDAQVIPINQAKK